MLPKRKRVNKELFQDIMQKGRVVSGSLFTLRYISQKEPQYAFVVPKIVSKKAPERSSMRRFGYNTLNSQGLKQAAAIFFYKKEAKNAQKEEIKADIVNLLTKIK
jgi:ribonuclease P protein component